MNTYRFDIRDGEHNDHRGQPVLTDYAEIPSDEGALRHKSFLEAIHMTKNITVYRATAWEKIG